MAACIASTPRRQGRISAGSDAAGAAGRPSPFGLLVQLALDDEQLLARLRRFNDRIESAYADLSEPGSHTALGLDLLVYLRAEYSDTLARLRANRRLARRVFEGAEPWG